MLHEACDIVADAGGWTCRTCRAHWRASFPPENCADTRVPVDAPMDRAALFWMLALCVGTLVCLAVGLAKGIAP